MSKNTTNLLPYARQKALEQEYWIRFATVVLMVATWLVVAAGVLLIPSYVFLGTSMLVKQEDLKNTEHTLSSSNEKDLLARLKLFENSAESLRMLKGTPSAVQTLATVLSVSRSGISLGGFAYVPSMGKAPRSVAVSGIASSRDALREYQQALQNTQGVSSAELPVSAYTKESEIPFTIVVAFLP